MRKEKIKAMLFPKNREIKTQGFIVYDAKRMCPIFADEVFPDEAVLDGFLFAENGKLYVDGVCGGEMFEVPKDGKYIIQFADGKYMRW